jgi:hypothetical protein
MSERIDIVGIIVEHALQFGDLVGRAEDLGRLLVEQEMVVAEMRSADMPVEILRLEIERECICENRVERPGISRTASGPRSVRVFSRALARFLVS